VLESPYLRDIDPSIPRKLN